MIINKIEEAKYVANELLTPEDAEKVQEANIAIRAADDLRKYAINGDPQKESDLIELLSKRPTLMQRFFPTQGQKLSEELAVQRLRQLRKDSDAVMALHQATYLQAANTIATVQLKKLGTDGQAALVAHYQMRKEETEKIILDSERRIRKDLFARKKEAEEDYADDDEFLQHALGEIRLVADANMQSTKKLIDGLLAVLDIEIK